MANSLQWCHLLPPFLSFTRETQLPVSKYPMLLHTSNLSSRLFQLITAGCTVLVLLSCDVGESTVPVIYRYTSAKQAWKQARKLDLYLSV
jgi:hypothetical protein